MRRTRSKLRLFASIFLFLFLLTGCSNENAATTSSGDVSVLEATPFTESPANGLDITSAPIPVAADIDTVYSAFDSASELTREQRNSIGMLNYLTVLTQEINASKNSRLYLESAYASLLNNTYPSAVDGDTLFQLNDILDILEDYRMSNVKRERLDFLYEQNRAQAIRDMLPSPLALMSYVQSFDLKKLVPSITYMAVDSVTSYTTSAAQADLQQMQDGWSLDEEESATLHRMRSNAFTYMITMVNTYDLPGDLALNEQSVSDFVSWKHDANIVRRIQLLESNAETYRGFTGYWLLLADSYYNNGDYLKCLEAIAAYESLTSRIFRKDYELAKALPVAISAAIEGLDGTTYVSTVERYLGTMLANTNYDDWALRYFAAQTYLDLYNHTSDARYLQEAYDIVLNNVTNLVRAQDIMNSVYLDDVQEAPVPKGATKKQKEEIGNYSKQLREERKTARAPIYEPLLLNCDLLFALARELDVPAAEMNKIDDILHENGEPIFLVAPLDDLYWFSKKNEAVAQEDISISFGKGVFTIPIPCVSDDATIRMTVDDGNGVTAIFEDWELTRVERKDKIDIDSFAATYASSTAKRHTYKAGATIRIEVQPKSGINAATMLFEYVVEETKTLGLIPGIAFSRIK